MARNRLCPLISTRFENCLDHIKSQMNLLDHIALIQALTTGRDAGCTRDGQKTTTGESYFHGTGKGAAICGSCALQRGCNFANRDPVMLGAGLPALQKSVPLRKGWTRQCLVLAGMKRSKTRRLWKKLVRATLNSSYQSSSLSK